VAAPALQVVAYHHEHVGRAAVLDRSQDAQPELGALAVAMLPGPQPEDVALAVGGDPEHHLDGPAGDLPVADLDVDDVNEQHRVHRIEPPGTATRPARPAPGR
jgi:hypothetical protein